MWIVDPGNKRAALDLKDDGDVIAPTGLDALDFYFFLFFFLKQNCIY